MLLIPRATLFSSDRLLGCVILSPTHIDPAREVDGFVFMRGEEVETPERIELKHLEAIQRAAFVWLHAPEGYVGPSSALEVGFAHAQGIPVFCRTEISDITRKWRSCGEIRRSDHGVKRTGSTRVIAGKVAPMG